MSAGIVVTGVGAVTALGATASATFDALLRGERGFRAVSLFAADGYRTTLVGEAQGIRREGPDDFSRTSELALSAAREALASAGISPRTARMGLVVGGTTAGMLETESLLAALLSEEGAVDPTKRNEALRRMLTHPLSAPTDRMARELGPFARTRTLSSACSGGANAVLVGATWLALDLVDAVLCGASDALCRVTLAGFGALSALDPEGSRPFDKRRRGLTLGEGAGFLVLERAGRRAGAKKRCALLGWAARSEAHHVTNPEPTGSAPREAMKAALARGGVAPSDVDYVNAHGTGTPLNDPMETRALEAVFGDALARVPVSSCKGQIGHTLGAAGAIEAVVTTLAIENGVIPPTGGLEEPDPECALRHVTAAEKRDVRAAVSSSFGFGGMDTVLLLGREPGAAIEAPRRRVFVTGVADVMPSDANDAALGLDESRARRFDRTTRLAAAAVARVVGQRETDSGIIVGSAFGAVDATSAFMRRLTEKGARLASPIDFPNLVPSSPAGHLSIYFGLHGPTFLVADLATSGECAFTQAFELIAAGEAERMIACGVEEKSAIVDEVLSFLFGGRRDEKVARTDRREGAAAVALSTEAHARASGLSLLAEVVAVETFLAVDEDLARIGEPSANDVVVTGVPNDDVDRILARSRWARLPRRTTPTEAGTHEAIGAMALTLATTLVAEKKVGAALVVGTARGSGYAVLLRSCSNV